MRIGEGGLWSGLGLAFEVAGGPGVGVVTPLVGPGSLITAAARTAAGRGAAARRAVARGA